jgi:kumamolisin
MDLVIALKNFNYKGLESYAQQVMDPASPNYRKFIDQKQMGQMFGAPQSDVDSVVNYMTSQGLKVTINNPSHMLISVTGPASSVEKAFNIKFVSYARPASMKTDTVSDTIYSPDHSPQLPSNVAVSVEAVHGLANLLAQTSSSHYVPPTGNEKPPLKGASNPNGGGASSPNFAGSHLTPWEASTYYGVDALHSAGRNGSSFYGMIYSPTSFDSSTVTYFMNYFYGVSPTIYEIAVDGGATDSGGALEATLDGQQFCGQAHNAGLEYFECPNDGVLSHYIDTFQTMVSPYDWTVCSDSWGWTESNFNYYYGTSGINSMEGVLAQMAAQGIAHYVASGDSNAVPGFPASSPFVTCVGGTDDPVDSGANYVSETGWGYDPYGGGGGGGLSSFFWTPSWQTEYISYGYRNMPDVAALGGPDGQGTSSFAYWVYYNGAWSYVWGTSAAAPVWAGSHVLFDQDYWTNRIGSLNGKLYQLHGSVPMAFHDVTTGNNGYAAGSGYDLVTGLGSPNISKLYYDIYGRPDLAPYNAWGTGPVDLHLTPGSTTEPLFFHDSQLLYWTSAQVNWDTTTDAAANYSYLYIDGGYLGALYMGAMSPYSAYPWYDYYSSYFAAGAHTVTMTSDGGNSIFETDETNNSMTRSIYVYPTLTKLTAATVKGGNPVPLRTFFSALLPKKLSDAIPIKITTDHTAIIPNVNFVKTNVSSPTLSVPTNAVGATTTVKLTVKYGLTVQKINVLITKN